MSRKPRLLWDTVSLLTVLGLGACMGGQTGGETGADWHDNQTPDSYAGESCDEQAFPLGPNELSPLGFGAAEVLAFVGESTTTPMVWLDTSALQVQTNVEPGPSELTVALLDSTNPRFVEVSPAESEDGGAMLPASDCPNRVDIDVTLRLTTADGALDETVPSTLHAMEADVVELVVPLDSANLTGTFRASPDNPNAELVGFTLHATYAPAGMSGELSATLAETDGEVASAAPIRFAEWNGE